MNHTWEINHWSIDSSFNNRNLISLLIALMIVWLCLQIPINSNVNFDRQNSVTTIELVKTRVLDQSSPVKITTEQNPVIHNTNQSSIVKPQAQSVPVTPIEKKVTPQPQTTEIISSPTKTPIVINKTPILPSGVDILNSLDKRQQHHNLDKDFLPKTESNDAFINKQIVTSEPPKLNTEDKRLTEGFAVDHTTPRPLQALKGFASIFGLAPVDDKEKTADDMTYCQTLGRKSIHCPSSNPLNYW